MKKLFLLCVFFSSCSYLQWYPEDNVVEEGIENAIKDKYDWDIDLSPLSKEKV